MLHVDVFSEQNIDSIIAVELLELKENKILMRRIETKGLIEWMKVKFSYPSLFEKIVPLFLSFLITWLVAAGFSATNDVFTKKRNLSQIAKRGDLCLKLNLGLKVQLDKLIDRSNVVINLHLYFQLHFVFGNKMYFLLHRIFTCVYGTWNFFHQKWATMKKRLRNIVFVVMSSISSSHAFFLRLNRHVDHTSTSEVTCLTQSIWMSTDNDRRITFLEFQKKKLEK